MAARFPFGSTTSASAADANWSAAGMVELFDDANRRRHRRRLVCVSLLLIVVLGIPLVWLRSQIQDATRRALLTEYDLQQARLEKLPAGNPAIDQALKRSRELRSAAAEKAADLGIAELRQAIQLIDQAEDLERDLRRLRELLNPLGATLLETPWHDSSDVIKTERTRLQRRHQEIGELLDQGKMEDAEKTLAIMLTEIGELQRQNVAAMQTDVSRGEWLRQAARAPQRLRTDAAFLAIQNRAKQGDDGWKAGDWSNARLSYSGAVADLQRLMGSTLTPDEKAQLQAGDATAIARLESEKAALEGRVADLDQQLRRVEQQVVKAGAERQAALEQVETARTERDKLAQEAEAGRKLPQVERSLAAVNGQLTAAQQALAKLTDSEKTLRNAKDSLERQLAASQAEAAALRQATPGQGGNTPEARVTVALAKIAAEAAKATPESDLQKRTHAAELRLTDVLRTYDAAVALREQALNDNYLPTSQKVRAIDQTIAQTEAILTDLLKELDAPRAEQYTALQAQIQEAEQTYVELLKEVKPEHKDAQRLKVELDRLKSRQAELANSHGRHQGTSKLAREDLVRECRHGLRKLVELTMLTPSTSLGAGDVLEFTIKGITVRWVWCPPGSFRMGSPVGEAGRDTDEAQVDVVLKRGFWMMETECWQALWLAVTNEPKDWSRGEGDFYPAYDVSHDEATSFAQKLEALVRDELSMPSGWRFQLPTEAQWEYAMRAGSRTKFCFGDDDEQLGEYAWFEGNSGGTHHPVKTKKPNAWGVYDGHGSVWEWVSDWYGEKLPGGTDPQGPAIGSNRVDRGGGFASAAGDCRTAYRISYSPENRFYYLGFRLALVPVAGG